MYGLHIMNSNEALPSDDVFVLFQKLIRSKLGIHLPKQKRVMLGHRLLKRVEHIKAKGFSEYFTYINNPDNKDELDIALELITTNETFFFREPKHFDYITKALLPSLNPNKTFKIWCAACSTGEEPYSIAMLLSKNYGAPWSIRASDVNIKVLEQAKKGIYLDERTELLPNGFKKSFCAKGVDEYEGYLRVKPHIRKRVDFFQFNLINTMNHMEEFDLIFIRNVMIYFNDDTRQQIIDNISQQLKPKGLLFISHSETLHGLNHRFELVQPAIYRLKS
mgnify:CR=1 FL=1